MAHLPQFFNNNRLCQELARGHFESYYKSIITVYAGGDAGTCIVNTAQALASIYHIDASTIAASNASS